MIRRVLLLLVSVLPLICVAANSGGEGYFNANPTLTPQEKAALGVAQKWQGSGSMTAPPSAGGDGSVRFAFGNGQVTIVCAVLHICDVELQPGEQVNNLHVGDPRFRVETAISGSAQGQTEHLILKPTDVGLDTSLVVTTDRRTYHLRLRSHRSEFIARVGFTYPEDVTAQLEAMRTHAAQDYQNRTIAGTGEYLGNLQFAYEVTGNAPWKPVRVYNDGVKTIIQMPATMAQTEAPTLLVVRKDGGLFTDDDTVMVNYRIQNDRYIVDSLFEKAILIAGVGNTQDRITITRGK